jgi:hypothetical protein
MVGYSSAYPQTRSCAPLAHESAIGYCSALEKCKRQLRHNHDRGQDPPDTKQKSAPAARRISGDVEGRNKSTSMTRFDAVVETTERGSAVDLRTETRSLRRDRARYESDRL